MFAVSKLRVVGVLFPSLMGASMNVMVTGDSIFNFTVKGHEEKTPAKQVERRVVQVPEVMRKKVGGGGGAAAPRGPQSAQSVPSWQEWNSAPGPPSLHVPLSANAHVL